MQVDYTNSGKGSGRSQMPHRYFVKDFGKTDEGNVIIHIVFLDILTMRDKMKPGLKHLTPMKRTSKGKASPRLAILFGR
ncbi:MAG: hypothetical protein CMI18_07730 [Opitutaceae bacterium]|nr:hypothetical protein [Opitutaceae bacterium]